MTAASDAPAVAISRMRWWHLADVAGLESQVFDTDPWSAELFWSELAQRDSRHYVIARQVIARQVIARRADPRQHVAREENAARDGDAIIGYGGLAIQDDEAYIQTIGVVPWMRGRHVGTMIMVALLREARARGARSCGLEVRTDNHAARSLYARLGFVDIGVRRGYYQPSGGDAYVMRVRPIDTVSYGALLDDIEARAGAARAAS